MRRFIGSTKGAVLSTVPGLALTLVLGAAPAPSAAQDIIGACDAEIGRFCAAVEPGFGRLAACLYAHEDKLGEACDAAIGDHGDMLDLVFEEMRFVSQECAGDIAQFCSGDLPEGAGVFDCLFRQSASLGAGCAGVIDRLRLPSE